MNTQWLDSTSDTLAGFWDKCRDRFREHAAPHLGRLAQPRRQQQIRAALCALAVLWLLLALARLLWGLVPEPGPEPGPGASPPAGFVNPQGGAAAAATAVDIEGLASWNLFGAAGTAADGGAIDPADSAPTTPTTPTRKTQLNLRLRGVVAAADPGAARAIIAVGNRQALYAVGARLPLSGNVTLERIHPNSVVINNGGRQELLELFEANAVGAVAPNDINNTDNTGARTLDRRDDRELTALAEDYRRRLYSDPQSLSAAFRIAAVREGGQLLGYRVSAGSDREQFERLGFKPNDIVTGVNGVALTDPAKAMELYRVMRSAGEASFNVLRGDEQLTLVVGLDAGGGF